MDEKTAQIIPQMWVTDHFMFEEFVCPCCNRLKIKPVFYTHVGMLERIRQTLDFAIVVNSGYRCKEHNTKVGGGARSWHMLFATDIRPADNDPSKLKALYEMAKEIGFKGIGRYDSFIHFDLMPERVEWRG